MASVSISPLHLEAMCRSLHEKTHLSSEHAPAAGLGRREQLDHADELVHLIMVPYPLQGHINPMMQLAKMLIAKQSGLRITFVNNKYNHDRIQRSLATASSANVAAPKLNTNSGAGAQDTSSQLRLVWLDNGLPLDFDYNDVSPRIRELHVATSAMKDPLKLLLQGLNQESPHVSCVVFGSFCPWAHTAAVELGIPSVLFWTQSTSVFSIYYHAPVLAANGFFPYDKKSITGHTEIDEVNMPQNCTKDMVVSYIPGVPSLHASDFPTLLHIHDLFDPVFASIQSQLQILQDCNGIIINSFEELEKDAFAVIRAELDPCPVYNIGPLLPSAYLDGNDKNDTSIGASLFQEKNDCINWLDTRKTHSVLYISFGSMWSPSKEALEAIASGIIASKQPFLWVIRPSASLQSVCDILREKVAEDAKEYGLIIPWAPQLQVLSHPSIGAFLTHGGWNSTLESLSMGVPMIPLPLFSDQPTNCAYVCNVWKVGMALKGHIDDSVTSEAVERVVRTVLHEEEGKEMRRRAQGLREAARRAVLLQGSSSADLKDFVEAIMRKHRPQTQTS